MSTLPAPVLILGARSDIARALAHSYGAAGHPLQLAARDPAGLEADKADLALRHSVSVSTHAYDALDTAALAGFFDGLPAMPGVVISAVGYMPDQAETQANPELAARVVASNFTGPAAAFEEAARRMAAAGGGTLIGISSVAGDRGRAKNHWYGAAKAGFTAVLSGLRQQYGRAGVHVLTVKPGFVATRMTEGMDLPAPLTDSPEAIAAAIHRAAERRQNVYTPWKWRLIMGIITNLPEFVFKRLSF
ncbi:MAG: SDR family oxidoreductase [Pseudomonadota bacterium]